jgi:hypothetical protein
MPRFGTGLEPCPWLTKEEKSGNPYYLWDVEKEMTVEAKELNAPSYTAVSHTWGRWQKSEPESWKKLDGVKWLIPENSLFQVEDLPRILKGVPRKNKYVWLDLVCIPQRQPESLSLVDDEEQDNLANIAYQEIARQAKIFLLREQGGDLAQRHSRTGRPEVSCPLDGIQLARTAPPWP